MSGSVYLEGGKYVWVINYLLGVPSVTTNNDSYWLQFKNGCILLYGPILKSPDPLFKDMIVVILFWQRLLNARSNLASIDRCSTVTLVNAAFPQLSKYENSAAVSLAFATMPEFIRNFPEIMHAVSTLSRFVWCMHCTRIFKDYPQWVHLLKCQWNNHDFMGKMTSLIY